MESNIIKHFKCLIHPHDEIQRVSLDQQDASSVFCIECILSKNSNSSSIIPFPSFIDKVSTYYSENGFPARIGTSAPNELVEFLSKEEEVIEKLSKHIDSQKILIEDATKNILAMTTEILSKRKEELFQTLETQKINMKANFSYYRSKIDKYFGPSLSEEEILNTKEKVIKMLNTLQTTEDLDVFVSQAKDDLIHGKELQRDNKILESLRFLSKNLHQQMNILPIYPINDFSKREDALETIKKEISSLINKNFSELSGNISKLKPSVGSPALISLLEKINTDKNAAKSLLKLVNESKDNLDGFIREVSQDNKTLQALIELATRENKGKDALLLITKIMQQRDNKDVTNQMRTECVRAFTTSYYYLQNIALCKQVLDGIEGVLLPGSFNPSNMDNERITLCEMLPELIGSKDFGKRVKAILDSVYPGQFEDYGEEGYGYEDECSESCEENEEDVDSNN